MNTKRTMTGSALTLLLALAGAAQAQQHGVLEGRLDQPLEVHGGSGTTTMVESENGDTWSLEMSGESITVKHNDQVIPADRVRRGKGKVEVLGADGQVEKTFQVAATPGRMVIGRVQPDGRQRLRTMVTPRWQEMPQVAVGQAIEQPKVMVGVRMNDADGHVVIEDVIDGTPAAKAGLQAGDVLLVIDGKDVAESKDVRAVLKDKDVGDVVEVKYQRDGKDESTKVTLAAYNAEKIAPAQGQANAWGWSPQDEDRWVEAAKKHVEEAIEMIKKSDALNSEKMKVSVEQTMREALKAINEAGKHADTMVREFSARPGMKGEDVVIFGPEGNQRFLVPGLGDEGTSQKLDRLSEQLERMNERLDTLQKRLEKLDKKP